MDACRWYGFCSDASIGTLGVSIESNRGGTMRSVIGGGCGLALSLLLSACGGGGDSYSGGGSPTNPSPPPSGGGTTITIVGDRGRQSFSPNPGTATQGQALTWRNNDGVVHRIVSNDASFDTGNIAPGAVSSAVMLGTDGTNYHCSIHPTMVGSISGSSGNPPACTGPYC
jgi:plastocyanin